MHRVYITIISLLTCYHSWAQPASLYFENITTQNGLSHNKVNCIIQDKRGFIWIGTDDGLNRYDGSHFTIFKNNPGDTTSISGNIIRDIFEDENEVLWVATADGGLTRYDYRLEPGRQFRQFKNKPNDSLSIPVNIIFKIVQDSQGYLWLASSGFYALRFDKKTERFSQIANAGTKTVLALTLRNTGELWAGRQGGGLLKINPVTMTATMDARYADLYSKDLPHVTITSLFTDTKKNTWFGSWDWQLYKYDHLSGKELTFKNAGRPGDFQSDEILSFAEARNGLLWMGGRNNGLQIYDQSANKFYNYLHDPARGGTLADNEVNCIFIDNQGLVWIGTSMGISISKPLQNQFQQNFLPRTGKRNISINDFYEPAPGELWLGTSEGIYTRDKNADTFCLRSITKFYKSLSGDLYVGSDYSLFKLNPENFSISMLPNTDKDTVMYQIIRSSIVSVIEDSINKEPVLIASPYGHFLAYYFWSQNQWSSRLDTSRQILKTFNITDNLVRKLYKSPNNGNLYMATGKHGLAIWDRKTNSFSYIKNDPTLTDGLSNNNVTDLVEDDVGNLWITTHGGGLQYFNAANRSIRHIPASNNLLRSISLDNAGNPWMISNGNIDKYDPDSGIYSTYQLPDIDKTTGVDGSIFKNSLGHLFVAGTNYFIEFDPAKITQTQPTLPIYITDFRIFNQSKNQLLKQEHISLSYNQNFITIEFAAPNFAGNRAAEFQYRLSGLNEDWTELGTENKVNLSNLAIGTYSFQLRATNRPGIWYNYKGKLVITITPPFYKTWWFFAICIVGMAGIIYAIYRYRINEIIRRQDIRNKIAQDLHDNVGSTLSSIGVYSQVAKIYNQQQKNEQLRDALDKISETSGNMISEMSDIVWTINPRNDSMPVMLQRMESFAKPLLAAREIRFHFDYDPGIESLSLGMTQRKNFYLIFKEAVNNAVKYAECLNLYVTIQTRNFRLEMIIRDDGKGFEVHHLTEHNRLSLSGNGFKNMTVRAKEMKGSCEFLSEPGKGTTVTLQFPIT
ncbi:MAG: histidine kinase [Chitinophagaceae bacterium]|nr:MAG: histidine kinase [Chitinophagaceae bacterium]